MDGQAVEVARRTEYYKLTRAPAKVNAELAAPIKEMIEAGPSFGYRTVAALLGMKQECGAMYLPAQGLTGPQPSAGPAAKDQG